MSASHVFPNRHFPIAANTRSRPMRWRPTALTGLLLLAGFVWGSIDPAQARWRHHRHSGESSDRAEKKDKRAAAPNGPLFAVVSIGDQHVTLYGGDGVVARASVSTGMRGHPTPTGIFSIIQKERMHHSNIYSGAPMPYMQRITWSGVAMHAGQLPGYPASHGCIRLPHEFAQRLYWMTRIGQRVMVAPHEVVPVDMTHKNLPAPRFLDVQARSAAVPANERLANAVEAVEPAAKTDAATVELHGSSPDSALARKLNPLEFAQTLKAEASARIAAANKAAKAAERLAAELSEGAHKAAREYRDADNAARDVEYELTAVTRKSLKAQEEKAQDEETLRRSADAKAAFEAGLGDAQKKIEDARRDKEAKELELSAAKKAADEAELSLKAAIKAARLAEEVSSQKDDDARRAARPVKSAEANIKAIESRLAEAVSRVERSQGDEEEAKKTAEARAAMEAKLAEARMKLDAARKAKEAKDKEFQAAERAAEDADAAVKAAREVESHASDKEDEAHAAAKALKAAEAALKEMEFRIADTVRKTAKAHIDIEQNEELVRKANEAKSAIEAKLADAQRVALERRQVKDAKDQELAAARKAASNAQAEVKAASVALKEATRRLEPVSILISKKTGRVYVRQAFTQLFDAPVSVSEPERPLGTHLFVARRAAEDGFALRWAAMSMAAPAESRERRRREHSRRRSAKDERETPVETRRAPESATGALDRITIPEETAQRIAELTWLGASLIITDHGISGETGAGTDFVILTRTRASAP